MQASAGIARAEIIEREKVIKLILHIVIDIKLAMQFMAP